MRQKYRSGLEAKVAAYLKKQGIRYEYEPHKISFQKQVPNGFCSDCGGDSVRTPHTYLPDFFLPDFGFYIEVKGKFTPDGRNKIRAILECHPDLDLRMLFQRDNWLSKKHHMKYSDWCNRNDILFHISSLGEVPEEWINKKQ